jgi:hypothetical protein
MYLAFKLRFIPIFLRANLTEADPVSKTDSCSEKPSVDRPRHSNVPFETVADISYGRIVDGSDGPLRRGPHVISRRKMSSTLLEGSHPFSRSSFPYP